MFNVEDPVGSDIKGNTPRPGRFDVDFDVGLLRPAVSSDVEHLLLLWMVRPAAHESTRQNPYYWLRPQRVA